MEFSQLGATELNISSLGVGGLHFGVYLDGPQSERIIHQASEMGVNFLDTAPPYGHGGSEKIIGNAIRKQRDRYIVATKVGVAPVHNESGAFSVEYECLTRATIRNGVERSLSQLGTDYIDLYMVHAFDPSSPLQETMDALSELVDEGKIRAYGCSNYSPDELENAKHHGGTFAAAQVHYNMLERRAEGQFLDRCAEDNVSVICNRALARGLLTGKYRIGKTPPGDSRAADSERINKTLTNERLQVVSTLQSYAQERGRSVTELALAWLLSQDAVASVLLGVRNPAQLEMCAKAGSWQLNTTELNEIESIIMNTLSPKDLKSSPTEFFEKQNG